MDSPKVNTKIKNSVLLQNPAFAESSEYFRKLRRHQVFEGFLSRLTLSETHRAKLLLIGLTNETIDFLLIKTAPGLIVNLEACSDLAKQFGTLENVPGFVKTEFGNFRFDIFDSIAGIGLLCAERISATRIAAIRLFRGLRDENSFRVQSQKERVV